MDKNSSDGLFEKLQSNNVSEVYQALVTIKNNYHNQKHNIKKYGAIKIIITLIEYPKLSNVSLSILANCCLDDSLRIEVLKCNGVKCLVRILQSLANEDIQNRACRALANIAMDVNGAIAVHKYRPIPYVVKFLTSTIDECCQQTAVRALRLLANCQKSNELIIQERGILPVVELLNSKNSQVVQCCVKALTVLTRCCNRDCAKQIQEGNGLNTLVNLSTHTKESIKGDALVSLVNLAKHSIIRPELGCAGAIPLFIAIINDSQHSRKNRLFSVSSLCLCCKEAVNRVRIREADGLKILLNILNDDDYSEVHEQIVISLLAFRYDEESLHILLELGLIKILTSHLEKYTKVNECSHLVEQSDEPPNKVKKTNSNQFDYRSVNEEVSITSQMSDTNEVLLGTELNAFESVIKRMSAKNKCKSHKEKTEGHQKYEPMEENDSEKDSIFKAPEPNNSAFEVTSPVFSIHSPSYQGIQNTDSYNPQDTYCDMGYGNACSPISITSMSPDRCSLLPASPSSSSSLVGPWSPSPSISSRDETSACWSPVLSLHSLTYSPGLSPQMDDSSIDTFSRSECFTNAKSLCHQDKVCNLSFENLENPLPDNENAKHEFLEHNSDSSNMNNQQTDEKTSNKIKYFIQGSYCIADNAINVEQCHSSSTNLSDNHEAFLECDNDSFSFKSPLTEDRKNKLTFCETKSESSQLCKLINTNIKSSDINTTSEIMSPVKMTEIKGVINDPPTQEIESSKYVSCNYNKLLSSEKNEAVPYQCSLESCSKTDFQEVCSDYSHSFADKKNKTEYSKEKNSLSKEGNILIILSHLSQMEKISPKIAQENCIDALIDYIATAHNPESRAQRIMMRLANNFNCFENLILCDFVGKICKKFKNSHDAAICSNCHQLEILREKLLMNVSMVAESMFGVGTLAHILLTTDKDAQLVTIFAISNLIKQKTVLQKLLIDDASGLSILINLLTDSNQLIFRKASDSLLILFQSLREKTQHERKNSPERRHSLSNLFCKYKDNKFDVCFVVDDKSEVEASRSVLCENSDFFRALLQGHFVETTMLTIPLPDISKDALCILLHFLHGCCQKKCPSLSVISFETLLELIFVCDRFLLFEFRPIVKQYLLSVFKLSRAAKVYLISKQYNYPALAEEILQFIFSDADVEKEDYFQCLKELLNSLYQKEFLKDVENYIKSKFPGCRDCPLYKRLKSENHLQCE